MIFGLKDSEPSSGSEPTKSRGKEKKLKSKTFQNMVLPPKYAVAPIPIIRPPDPLTIPKSTTPSITTTTRHDAFNKRSTLHIPIIPTTSSCSHLLSCIILPPTLKPTKTSEHSKTTSHIQLTSSTPSSHLLPSTTTLSLSPASPTIVLSSDHPPSTPTSTPESAASSTPLEPQGTTSTTFITSIYHGATTVSTVQSSPMINTILPTDSSNRSFAHNAGAIAGVAVGAFIALSFACLWIYLTLRRKKQMRQQELNGSSEQVIISPDGGWRPPLEDGDEDEDDLTRYPTYANVLSDRAAVHGEDNGNDEGNDRPGSEHGASVGTASIYSAASGPPSSHGHPYMTGFGQAAETMRDDNTMLPVMTMADGAPLGSHHRSLSGGFDHATWFGGREASNPNTQAGLSRVSSHGHSSAKGEGAAGSGSKNGSYEDAIYAEHHPARSSSSQMLIASSSSEVGSSSGRRGSIEAKRPSAGQSPSPPTSYSFRKRTGSDNHSLRGIFDRFRSTRGSSPGPITPEIVVEPPSAQSSTIRFPEPVRPHLTPSSSYGPTISTRSPTPPSSLLRPQPPSTGNFSSQWPAMPTPVTPDRLQSTLMPPATPSPAISDDSHDIASEGLLDPRLPWRLEQTRADSTASLRDHEDYSRPIGHLLVHSGDRSNTTLDTTNNTFDA